MTEGGRPVLLEDMTYTVLYKKRGSLVDRILIAGVPGAVAQRLRDNLEDLFDVDAVWIERD